MENFCVIRTVYLIELHFVYVHVANPEWPKEVSTVSESSPSEDLWIVSPNHLDQLDDEKKVHVQGVGVEKGSPSLKLPQSSRGTLGAMWIQRGTLDAIWIQTLLFPPREMSELLLAMN